MAPHWFAAHLELGLGKQNETIFTSLRVPISDVIKTEAARPQEVMTKIELFPQSVAPLRHSHEVFASTYPPRSTFTSLFFFHNCERTRLGDTNLGCPFSVTLSDHTRRMWSPLLQTNWESCTPRAGFWTVKVSWGRPTWEELLAGARPLPLEAADPGEWQHGWQYYASSASEHTFREAVVAQSHASDQAHLRSHSGPGAGAVLHGAPTGLEFQVQPLFFRTLVLERLRLPLLLTDATCECGGQNDLLGRH